MLDALKAGEITLGAAKAFTVAEDEALTLTVLDQIKGRETSEHRIRQMLQPDATPEADPFDAFRAKGKKHRKAVLALALARSLKYSDRDPVFAKAEAETRVSLRQVWTPTAENFFCRVSADTLDALMLDLTGTDPQGAGFKAFRSQKKAAKALSLEKLFSDPDYQRVWGIDAEAKARIDVWVPDCF